MDISKIALYITCVLLLVIWLSVLFFKQIIFNHKMYKKYPLLENYYSKKDVTSIFQTGFIIFIIICISWVANQFL